MQEAMKTPEVQQQMAEMQSAMANPALQARLETLKGDPELQVCSHQNQALLLICGPSIISVSATEHAGTHLSRDQGHVTRRQPGLQHCLVEHQALALA